MQYIIKLYKCKLNIIFLELYLLYYIINKYSDIKIEVHFFK